MWAALYLIIAIVCFCFEDSKLRTRTGYSLLCISFTVYHQDIFYYYTELYGMFLGVFLYSIPLMKLSPPLKLREVILLLGCTGLVLNDLGFIIAYLHYYEESYPGDSVTLICLALILTSIKGAKHRNFRHIANVVRLCFSGCTSDTLHTTGIPLHCFYTAEKGEKPKDAQKQI